MKLGIKIATLIFFISGLVFFVGYQSGYFFPNETQESNELIEMDPNSSVEAIDADEDTVRTDSTIFKAEPKLAETETKKALPKTVTLDEVSNESLRMYSSKSAPVHIRKLHPDKGLRMSSSKSIRGRRSYSDIFKPITQKVPPANISNGHYLNSPELDSIPIFDTLK